MLPPRTPEAEDAYVSEWLASDDTEGLIDAVNLAMDARRPRLAARLVQLLGDHVAIEPGSALERAHKAAGLLLMRKPSAAENSWSELEEAWSSCRKSRMRRIRTRVRESMKGDLLARRVDRLGRRRR